MSTTISRQKIKNFVKDYKAGLSIKGIAQKHGSCRKTVKKYLLMHNLEPTQKYKLTVKDKRDICRLYKAGKLNQNELARKYNCTQVCIHYILKENSIDVVRGSNRKVQKTDIQKLCDHFGVTRWTISRILNK